jgi:hypothetical protein
MVINERGDLYIKWQVRMERIGIALALFIIIGINRDKYLVE